MVLRTSPPPHAPVVPVFHACPCETRYIVQSLPLILFGSVAVVMAGTRTLQCLQSRVFHVLPFGALGALSLTDVCVGILTSGVFMLYFGALLCAPGGARFALAACAVFCVAFCDCRCWTALLRCVGGGVPPSPRSGGSVFPGALRLHVPGRGTDHGRGAVHCVWRRHRATRPHGPGGRRHAGAVRRGGASCLWSVLGVQPVRGDVLL